MKRKGFTLIELLAVIIILGILMLIAIPSVTSYINNSRKETYVSTIKELVKGTSSLVNGGELGIFDTDTTYYIPVSAIELESGKPVSPYGDFEEAYIVVTTDGEEYNYYYVGKDTNSIGIPELIAIDLISNERIENDIESISTDVALKGTSKIVVFNSDGTGIFETKNALKHVTGGIRPICMPISDTIYWALQDTNSDGINDKLIISNEEVNGQLMGNFSGNTEFTSSTSIPWNGSDFNSQSNKSKNVTNVVVEGTVVPKSTAYWFFEVGVAASSLTMNLDNLKTCHVSNMDSMFFRTGLVATNWSIGDLSDWDVSNVTYMGNMFYQAGYSADIWNIGNINEWDVSNVTNMNRLFSCAAFYSKSFSLDLGDWDTSNVTDMNNMFYCFGDRSTSWNVGNIGKWDTSKVTDMSYMLESVGRNASEIKLDLRNWDVSNVVDMSCMFMHVGGQAQYVYINISGWNTSKVATMYSMFSSSGISSSSYNLYVSGLDVSNVTNMLNMFSYTANNVSNYSLDLSDWNTSKVTNMRGMFSYAGYSSSTFYLDLTGWDTSHVTNLQDMFDNAGHDATLFTIKISKTSGNNIDNTSTTIYGNSSSVNTSLNSGRTFTLVNI